MTAIPVTSPSGVALTGLTPGTVYQCYTTGGPWHPHGLSTGDDTYSWSISNDGGTTWSAPICGATNGNFPCGTPTLPAWVSTFVDLDGNHTELVFTATTTSVQIRVPDSVWSDNTGSLDIEITATACQFGSSQKPGIVTTWLVTSALIDLVVGAALAFTGNPVLIAYVESALVAIEGSQPLLIDCSVAPASLGPPLDLTNLATLSPANLLSWFEHAAWNYACQCNPGSGGSPPPVPPVDQTPKIPPGVTGTPNPILCNNTDICSFLEMLSNQVAGVAHQLAVIYPLVTAIQRYGVPFAYVPATAQTGLSGTGMFTISRAIAFQMVLTAVPPARILPGNPVYIMDQGWVSISDTSGMLEEKRVTRQSMTWTPDDCQLATTFSYQLNPGVIMSVVPLLAEP